jgi:tetratricopeptide (TPR) repeat protein
MKISEAGWGLPAVVAAFLTAACAAPMVILSQNATHVQIAPDLPLPDLYTEVGPLHAQDGDGCGGFGTSGTYAGAVNTLRNQAATVGADMLRITSAIGPHLDGMCGDNSYKLDAIAYRSTDIAADDAAFAQVVRAYRGAAVPPTLSEDARRFKVQAEFAVRDKNYPLAVELYGKALRIDPWWPQGHFNRALVLAESHYYLAARGSVREMKRYLDLQPDAPDARAAQNKIYEWELQINK